MSHTWFKGWEGAGRAHLVPGTFKNETSHRSGEGTLSHHIHAQDVRHLLDKAFDLLASRDATKTAKLKELWAVMNAIQFWMEDVEDLLRAQDSRLVPNKKGS